MLDRKISESIDASAEDARVTDILYARLTPQEIDETTRRLNPEERSLWARSAPAERKRILLALGAFYQVEGLLRRTGLTATEPPEDVHAMSRGKFARAGSFHYADLLMEAAEGAGIRLAEGAQVLDFGCSSGRVVRVLAAAYPNRQWFGCDPNERAIRWARSTLPNIKFTVSPLDPPLPYGRDMFDAVLAVSVWSHFGPRAARRWFEEMRRIIRPGGHLIFTTHGHGSLRYYARNGRRPAEQLAEIAQSLRQTGFWFQNEFGPQGDWGIVHAEWGTAFVAPEWWLTQLCPNWSVSWFQGGRVEGNQDIIVIQRRV